ncbi:collagenase [Roseateles oligotrophus]|uniref:Collagenase n=1 Tax=Roseateles oligotrophus TaxID=1769250 RepID=A0ABT2Y9E9_9BURK|nr:collagenase [Roseateles oligotrophus]MCV2366903.1 collagenase [Roseateles oligotrophus]
MIASQKTPGSLTAQAALVWGFFLGCGPGHAEDHSAPSAAANLVSVEQVLSRAHRCSATLELRSQALSPQQEAQICGELAAIEIRFHRLFGTEGRPVKHDLNNSLRANIYASGDEFVRYAGQHFDMPTNNGGMYLEGLPERVGNRAEFVANQKKDGSVRNLGHEYVHYLDGRFNLYGDFCANLHDSHDAPENCPKPAPQTPYLIWWTEGVAEYIARGADHPKAMKAAGSKAFALSQLFDTGYMNNGGDERVYAWGYLAARFMLERQRVRLEQMLAFTRSGDYPRYQALLRGWGSSLDAEFAKWLEGLSPALEQTAQN